MRVVFASLAAPGHAYPLVPLAVAAQRAGHDVHFAVGEEVHAALRGAGLAVLRPGDCFYEMYPEDLQPELERLRAELVVHEWGLPGAAVAAQRAGIPSLWHGFGRMYPAGIGLDLPADVADRPHLDICPASLQEPGFLATAERIPLRPVAFSPPGEAVRIDGPFVYVTLGTSFGTPEVLRAAVAGVAGLGMRVVVAAGQVPPARLGHLPRNVAVHGWVAQADVLPRATLVVHHGGSGTTLGALAAGVPQLLLPQGADQFGNAEAVTTAGAGLTAESGANADAIEDLAWRLLPGRGDEFRAAARTIAAEIARMPPPDDVVRDLMT
ncbi:glycosyltransferase [Dactylosporangium darangshiense]|uniref:Glycosyltransferase n=1 Tax=Dactylosporangium darangshiense TaxID=579108 RepID=A0ABP8DT27_9ACTN